MGLWHSLRTIVDLGSRVNALEDRSEELELEWIDKKDAFERLLKRLAIRERRAADAGGDGVELAGEVGVGPAPQASKDALRQFARARGIIR